MKAQKIVLWDQQVLDTVQRIIGALDLDGKFEIIIRRFSESVSDRQRGYYRSTVLPALMDLTGYTEDEMHEWLRLEFGPTAQIKIHGVAHDVAKFSTSKKGQVAEMQAYLERVCEWAAGNLGCYIPPPNRDWRKEKKAA